MFFIVFNFVLVYLLALSLAFSKKNNEKRLMKKNKKENKKEKKGNVINRKNGSTDKRTKEQVLEFAVFPSKGWCSPTCTSSITSPPPSP